MSDFLVKSKDMYAQDPERFPHFLEVFQVINEMSVAKNYYNTDLFNIEEILSLLEIREFVEGRRLKDVFSRYISDVIMEHTPLLAGRGKGLPSNWEGLIFGQDPLWRGYGYFVLNLCNVRPSKEPLAPHGFTTSRVNEPKTRYDVVTLNYDKVIEVVVNFLNATGVEGGPIALDLADEADPCLAKLHGSAGASIVPPTWSKGTHPEIVPIWNQAMNLLRNANHIRLFGYSLPTADSYVKYLLKAAALNAPHLKHIDVLCLDRGGDVRARFDELITFPRYRFKNASVTEYFATLLDLSFKGWNGRPNWFTKLEDSHAAFFDRPD